MINNISPKPTHRDIETSSSPPNIATDNVASASVGSQSVDKEALRPAGGIQTKKTSVNARRPWSVPLTKSAEIMGTTHQSETSAAKAQELTGRLLNYLRIGSNDSLNIIDAIFTFHRYDKTLLNRYISDQTPKNLRALETQIENRLFVVVDQSNVPNRRET